MPAPLKYAVALSIEERQNLEVISRSGRHSPREKMRARILLLADYNGDIHEGGPKSDEQIAQSLHCTRLTVAQVRRRATERGAVAVVAHKPQQRRKPRALDGEQEAQLVVLCCSEPPKGRKRWTLKMLKDRLIELEVVENIGCETIRRTLKKTR
jgi:transposase